MKLNSLHLLLTYQCTFECDHCFVWGSPWQNGTMTIKTVRNILSQATEAGSVEWIYFEGGEPFLYYQLMVEGITEAIKRGFKVGIVTNSYWATSEEDARLWLSPLVDKIQDLTISSDLFHFSEKLSQQSKFVTNAAERLNIPLGIICIEQLDNRSVSSVGQISPESVSIMYRGRAAEKLVPKAPLYPAERYIECPHENLTDPGRVHIDILGEYIHLVTQRDM
jgi:organic radical activating enzyme